MKVLIVALVALVAAVVAGHYVAADPGFIVIGYGGKVIRTSFAVFMAAAFLAFLALHGLINLTARLRGLRSRWRHWSSDHRRRKAHNALADGLMAMANGDFSRAERLFRGGVEDECKPEAHYLAAASAAHAGRSPARRDNYLSLAIGVRPEARNALELRRAEWLMDNGQVSEARPVIDRLTRAEPGNPRVLRLRMLAARAGYDYATLLELMPAVRRDRVLTHDDANALEREAAVALLSRGDQALEAVQTCFDGLARTLKVEPEVLSAYARALCRHGQHDAAETLLRKRLERQWDSGLAAVYGEIECEPPARQLRKIEAWSVTREGDPGLRLAHARQAIRAGHWGIAREHLQALMARAPSPMLLELLAQVAEGDGQTEQAAAHRKAGLALAIGHDEQPRLAAPAAD